jgi:hypothetical protein
MAVTFKVVPGVAEEEQVPPQASINLIARKTLDGNFAIFDHLDIDVVVMPESNKVLIFPKNEMSEAVYEIQNRLLDYLRKNGVILPDSIQGGNVYGSMQGKYVAEAPEADSTQAVIYSISKFMEAEKPYFMWNAAHKAEEEDRLTDPSEENSTEYDPDLHDPKKGALPTGPTARYGGTYAIYE